MTPVVLGIGTAVPSLRIDCAESVDAANTLCAENDDQARLLENLYRQSGVERVTSYTALKNSGASSTTRETMTLYLFRKARETKGPPRPNAWNVTSASRFRLPSCACLAALSFANVTPDKLTHLITVSCTGFSAPRVDIALIKRLGMPLNVERTHVGFMGCHGALNGLRVARGLLAVEPSARVLLCSVELCSLHYAYGWNPKKVVANALFADGAAAVLLGNEPSPGEDDWRLETHGACLFPDSEQAMAWFIRDHGFDMVLSSKVPNLIRRNLGPWLSSWLARHNMTVGEVASWAVHPGGPRVLTCVQEALDLPPDATTVSRTVLESYGNMSSATLLFILKQLIKQRAARPCVALGFGPGMAAEAGSTLR